MADINECKKLLEYRATKSGFNGNLSPNDFNLLWNRAEQRYFNFLYKQYGINKDNTDSLVRFKSDPVTVSVPSTGKFTKPDDLLHVDAIRNVSQKPMTEVNDDRIGAHLDSTYDAPTNDYGIYCEYKTYIQFYPMSIGSAIIVYLKKLVPAKWAYTIVDGRAVYSPSTSIQPVWSDADIDEIIYLVGTDLGLNMRDQLEIQVNDQKAKENV